MRPRPFILLFPLMLSSMAAHAADAPDIDPAVDSDERAGRDAALVIGNEGYKGLPQAIWAQDDARSFRDWAQVTRGISSRRVLFVADADAATMKKLARRASWRVRKRGTLWVYYAGHGTVDDAGTRLLLPVDADAGNLQSRAVRLEELVEILRRTKRADRVLVMMDAGFGNVARDGLDLVPGRNAVEPAPFPTDDERVAYWSADRALGPSHPFEPAKHGLFTWTAMGGLRGWADGEVDGRPDGRVTLAEAQLHALRVGRQLGRDVDPWRDPRSAQGSWTIAQGEHLEEGPDDSLLDALGQADVRRRMDAAEQLVRTDATLFWEDTVAQAQAAGQEGKAIIEAFVDDFGRSSTTISWAVSVPEVREARRILATWEQTGGLGPAAPSGGPVRMDAGGDEPCDDIISLESPSMLGELSPGQRNCLEERIGAERLQTARDSLSRLLIVNAQAAGEEAEWESLMMRHLEDIDRSDPDLCFSFAIHLHRTRALENAEEAVRWADVALENKQRWTGEVHVQRVNGLLRLRAEAGNRLWVDAEERYQQERTSDTDADARDYRGLAKDTAREWLDYARASAQPTDTAYRLCISAAGTKEFCTPPR